LFLDEIIVILKNNRCSKDIKKRK